VLTSIRPAVFPSSQSAPGAVGVTAASGGPVIPAAVQAEINKTLQELQGGVGLPVAQQAAYPLTSQLSPSGATYGYQVHAIVDAPFSGPIRASWTTDLNGKRVSEFVRVFLDQQPIPGKNYTAEALAKATELKAELRNQLGSVFLHGPWFEPVTTGFGGVTAYNVRFTRRSDFVGSTTYSALIGIDGVQLTPVKTTYEIDGFEA
jgi:hypothetical protein